MNISRPIVRQLMTRIKLQNVLKPATPKQVVCCFQIANNQLSNYDNLNLAIANQRCFCSQSDAKVEIAYYDEIKNLPNHPEKILIDVRNPEELKETGVIPTSINIPLADVKNVLGSMDEESFRKMYGIAKPKKDQNIIFHCMIGKRSQKASEMAVQVGYKNVKNYVGSWTEWTEKMK